ncbi:MAG: uracil-DNA glycosylase [Sphingomicrobium sp.]
MTAPSTLDDKRAMGGNLKTVEPGALDSLIGWWREAGVEVVVGETPRGWLRADEAASPVSAPAPATTASVAEPPADFAAFRDWLATSSGLPMDRSGAVRVAPHGTVGAPVMLLSDLPGGEDAAEGKPIGGAAYALAVRMLAAIGVEADAAYFASLACFHAPGARIGGDELEACAALARDHIRHAKPQRLILLGDAPARALLGEPLARVRGRVHKVEGVRTVATFHPRWLLQRPSDKALAWRDLLLLMSEND